MEKKKLTWPFRAILFLLILCTLLYVVSLPLVYPYDDRAYEWTKGLYEERERALDAVFIGTSNTYAFWSPLFAWGAYGIATYSYAVSSQKIESFRYMIEEARKTQPDALYVISLGNPNLDVRVDHVHFLTDYMAPSLNKLRLILAYFRYNDYSLTQKAELLAPLLRYHSRWDELSETDFRRGPVFAKGANRQGGYLKVSSDVSDLVRRVDARRDLSAQEEEALLDLLDYLEAERVRALFVNPPQLGFTDEELEKANTALDRIEERGFPVLHTRDLLDEIGLDFSKDFYNEQHTNIHGAAKYTRFLAEYLRENYTLSDKRGEPGYADFDEAFDAYMEFAEPYALDFEIACAERDPDLPAPAELTAVQEGEAVRLGWKDCGADGYLVYRQTRLPSQVNSAWTRLADLRGTHGEYIDPAPGAGQTHFYTVVPYRLTGETLRCGDFSYAGIGMEVMEHG